jgi:PhnB protein
MKPLGNHLSWIVAKDINRSVKFFTEVLGLHILERCESESWVELSAGEGALLGIAQENEETKSANIAAGDNAVVCFSVANIETARKELLSKKARLIGDVVEVPTQVKMQLVQDDDGNLFHIVESLKVDPIPCGYHSISPYLTVNNGAKAIDFYKQALGAEELSRFEGPQGKIMHSELKIGDSIIMVADEYQGKDACGMAAPTSLKGSSVMLHLYVPDVDASFAKAVKNGAKVLREPADMFWGDRYAQIEDPFGHRWAFATNKERLSREEIEKRAVQCFTKK